MRPLVLALVIAAAGTITACTPRPATPQDAAAPTALSPELAPIDARFTAEVLDAAAAYPQWVRVTEAMNWAPTLCSAPTPEVASRPVLSRSSDIGTHGRKLYHLFAKDPAAYGVPWAARPDRAGSPALDVEFRPTSPANLKPTQQALVKQSWATREVKPGTAGATYDADGRPVLPGEQGPLFVMLKLAPGTLGTDEGWVYATLTPDGKTITAAGRIASCMECHTKAPRDRLFGLPK